MPDLAIHYYFGQSVLQTLPDSYHINRGEFDFALSGPDDWFYCFTTPDKCSRGSYMHRNKTGQFLKTLASEPLLFSYCAGFLCHYILDATCHPYIIFRTGFYEHTKQTRQYRGNHTAFERALDRWILGPDAGRHPLTDNMLGRPLSGTLEPSVNRVYDRVFGWDHIFPELLRAKQNMKKYLRLLEDPQSLSGIVTGIIPHPSLQPLSYSRHYYQNEDILNLSHQEWHHPKDPSLRSTRSFPELMEEARQEAVKIITAVRQKDLSLIGNRSYLTGFDLEDRRNQAKDQYSLLKR